MRYQLLDASGAENQFYHMYMDGGRLPGLQTRRRGCVSHGQITVVILCCATQCVYDRQWYNRTTKHGPMATDSPPFLPLTRTLPLRPVSR